MNRTALAIFPDLPFCCFQVCSPPNAPIVVQELSAHPQVLADILSLSAVSDAATLSTDRGISCEEPGSVPCIENLREEEACPVADERYQVGIMNMCLEWFIVT